MFLKGYRGTRKNNLPEVVKPDYYPLTIFLERKSIHKRSKIIISDVDKTYLNTDFESLKGLLWIPFEVAVDKVTIEKMNLIYQALRYGTGSSPALTPLFFITASPPFIYSPLTSKMIRDGVEYDGIVMKDQDILLKKMEFKQLKSQVTYKLFALFSLINLIKSRDNNIILLGDDTESDLSIYLLFKKIVEENPPVFKAADLLLGAGVDVKYLDALLKLIREFNGDVRIKYIFIYLSKGEFVTSQTLPVVQYRNSEQLAIFFHQKRLISDYYLAKIVQRGSEKYNLAVEWLKDYGYL